VPIFGRKKAAAPPPPPPPGPERRDMRGHEAVLRHLRTLDATDPERRLQVGGMVVFDLIYQMVATAEKGARIEDVLAILGSVGGHSCLVGVLDGLARGGATPTGQQLLVGSGTDGNRYYFGDLPNQALLESPVAAQPGTGGRAGARRPSVSRQGS
jgi:hypothetical protein